jgi:hypothetical protein
MKKFRQGRIGALSAYGCRVDRKCNAAKLTRMDFFHPVISKSCEAMGVASQGAIVQSITGWNNHATALFVSC